MRYLNEDVDAQADLEGVVHDQELLEAVGGPVAHQPRPHDLHGENESHADQKGRQRAAQKGDKEFFLTHDTSKKTPRHVERGNAGGRPQLYSCGK